MEKNVANPARGVNIIFSILDFEFKFPRVFNKNNPETIHKRTLFKKIGMFRFMESV